MATYNSTDLHNKSQLHIEGEIWRPVVGYEGFYEVSDYGRVRRAKSGRILAGAPNSRGYIYVQLHAKTRKQGKSVHTLVAAAFIGEKQPHTEVNHKDGNKLNNHVLNLEYVTHQANMNHAVLIGKFDFKGDYYRVVEQIQNLLRQDDPILSYREIAIITNTTRDFVEDVKNATRPIHKLRGAEPIKRKRAIRKLTDDDIQTIRELTKTTSMLQREIADIYGISKSAVCKIKWDKYESRRRKNL